jgi:hypothetical protein
VAIVRFRRGALAFVRMRVSRIGLVACGCIASAVLLTSAFSAPAVSQGQVPATFGPWAASFVSPATGFVLGGVGCRFSLSGFERMCQPVVVTTSDGGATWRRVSAPAASFQVSLSAFGGSAVRAITFADSRNGWLFEPGFWATHDGGRHWAPVSSATSGSVATVIATNGWAYAVVTRAGDEAGILLRSPVSRDEWRPVRSLPGRVTIGLSVGGESWLLAAYGDTVWAGVMRAHSAELPGRELWRSVHGAAWQRLGDPCGNAGIARLSPSSATDLLIACADQQPDILLSTDGGVHTRPVSRPADDTLIGPLAAPLTQSKAILLAVPSNLTALTLISRRPPAQSWLDRTADIGRSWTRASYTDHGAGWADLQFVSPTVGWVVHGYPGAAADELMRTANAGVTFTDVRF